jgi:SAM-dependent methyltransferase
MGRRVLTGRSRANSDYQRRYFADRAELSRLAPGDTPYIRRHLEQVVALGQLTAATSILEVGAGVGRFTLPLLARGFTVTASDLSPELLARLRTAAPAAVETVAADVARLPEELRGTFDRVVGFFVLHHLVDFDRTFTALAQVLRPGGRLAFAEPVAVNPLYYAQILLTPTMRFAAEPSLTAMRAGRMLPALCGAGFVEAAAHPYGYFPPLLKNTPLGDRLERWLERRLWVPFPHAFQVFTARRPG